MYMHFILLAFLKFERRETAYNLRDTENKLNYHCSLPTIIKIA